MKSSQSYYGFVAFCRFPDLDLVLFLVGLLRSRFGGSSCLGFLSPTCAETQEMPHHENRPTKICPVCERPFQWRRKWKDVWEEVRYCSERCRRQRSAKGA